VQWKLALQFRLPAGSHRMEQSWPGSRLGRCCCRAGGRWAVRGLGPLAIRLRCRIRAAERCGIRAVGYQGGRWETPIVRLRTLEGRTFKCQHTRVGMTWSEQSP
jgi:hypothetical protein